ncbi:MAG: hypothetical protein FWD68_12270 [Alphaproteobacteria bacterium]|nr:hypothetical protein [Alphaproteobacteria bacterium]
MEIESRIHGTALDILEGRIEDRGDLDRRRDLRQANLRIETLSFLLRFAGDIANAGPAPL